MRPYYTDGVGNEAEARQHYQGRELKLYDTAPKFDGTSSYKQEYPAHPYQGRPQGPPVQQYAGSGAAFDGSTTYKQEFNPHPFPERPCPGQKAPYSTLPFEGSSTYGTTYTQHPLDMQGPSRPGEGAFPRNTAAFDGTSSYRQDFVPQQLPPGRQPHQQQPYNTLPFEGNSSYKDYYQPYPYDPSTLPHNYALAQPPANNAPFSGTTTNQDTYRGNPGEPRPPARQAVPQSTLPFAGNSSYYDQYKAWPMDPTGRAGPPQQPMRATAPFDGTTSNREFFKGWQLPSKRPPIGVEMLGDRSFVLIPAEAPLPAVGKQMFTTVHDNQTDMCILVLGGSSRAASQCPVLGQFDITGLPPGPAGAAKIEVTCHLDANNVLQVSAVDLDTNRHQQWLSQGKMTAWSRSDMVREAR